MRRGFRCGASSAADAGFFLPPPLPLLFPLLWLAGRGELASSSHRLAPNTRWRIPGFSRTWGPREGGFRCCSVPPGGVPQGRPAALGLLGVFLGRVFNCSVENKALAEPSALQGLAAPGSPCLGPGGPRNELRAEVLPREETLLSDTRGLRSLTRPCRELACRAPSSRKAPGAVRAERARCLPGPGLCPCPAGAVWCLLCPLHLPVSHCPAQGLTLVLSCCHVHQGG